MLIVRRLNFFHQQEDQFFHYSLFSIIHLLVHALLLLIIQYLNVLLCLLRSLRFLLLLFQSYSPSSVTSSSFSPSLLGLNSISTTNIVVVTEMTSLLFQLTSGINNLSQSWLSMTWASLFLREADGKVSAIKGSLIFPLHTKE